MAIAALLTAISLAAPMPGRTEPEGSYFAIIVSDIEESVAWYTSVLALNESSSSKTERFEIVNLRGPGLFVELIELTVAEPRPAGIRGPFKVGFVVDDLGRFIEQLPDSMPEPDVINDGVNSLQLMQLRDPDGNIIQVMDFD